MSDENSKANNQEVHNSTVYGDVVGGNKTTVRDINNSDGVAIGTGASATVNKTVGQVLQPDDRNNIKQELDKLRIDLEGLQEASEEDRRDAEKRLDELEQALTAEDAAVDLDSIKKTVTWLVTTMPTLSASVRSVLESPALKKLLESAGQNIDTWLKFLFS